MSIVWTYMIYTVQYMFYDCSICFVVLYTMKIEVFLSFSVDQISFDIPVVFVLSQQQSHAQKRLEPLWEWL